MQYNLVSYVNVYGMFVYNESNMYVERKIKSISKWLNEYNDEIVLLTHYKSVARNDDSEEQLNDMPRTWWKIEIEHYSIITFLCDVDLTQTLWRHLSFVTLLV